MGLGRTLVAIGLAHVFVNLVAADMHPRAATVSRWPSPTASLQPGPTARPDPPAQSDPPILPPAAPAATARASPPPAAPAATASPVSAPAAAVPAESLIALATGSVVHIYAVPDAGTTPRSELPGTNPIDQPQVFLVVGQVPGWLQVLLPVKPNGSTGWVSSDEVRTGSIDRYLRVWLSGFRLEHYIGGHLQDVFTVAVGSPGTPTPPGLYSVWASQTDDDGAYYPGLFALSGFSTALTKWPGGGQIGIHGWRDASANGKQASDGCVRMLPEDFAKLYKVIPLGTPVEILP